MRKHNTILALSAFTLALFMVGGASHDDTATGAAIHDGTNVSGIGAQDAIAKKPERKPFRFTVSTDIETAGKDVVIPINVEAMSDSVSIKYDLDCDGDGKYESKNLKKNSKCVFKKNSGNHTISIRGDIAGIELCDCRMACFCEDNCNFDSQKAILSVDDWGDIEWRTMTAFAQSCQNLRSIPSDAPNLSKVTEMDSMFAFASSFNQPLEHWDVSHVTSMQQMFLGAKSFNQPLEKWNVSNVEGMSEMFDGAASFNQPLGKWDVSKVEEMNGMFQNAVSFNQPLASWNVANVSEFARMFNRAKSFNQPLEKWNVSSAENMEWMFHEATSFDQPLDKWNVATVGNMRAMFKDAAAFSHYPAGWVVPQNSAEMFDGTKVAETAKSKPLARR